MLSKSRGRVLRVASVLHMLFSINDMEHDVGKEISETALKVAVNFVQVACQHTAFIAGKGT